MTSGRKVALFLTLPIIVMLERAAYYGTRSILPSMLTERGMPMAEVYQQYGGLSIAMAVAPLAGGILAIGAGPRVTAIVGAALAVAAYFLLASALPFVAAGLLWALALGLFKPAIFAMAGQEVRGEPETRFGALFVLMFAAIGTGGGLGPVTAAALFAAQAEGALYGAGAGMFGAAVLLAIVIATAPKTATGLRMGAIRAPASTPSNEVGSVSIIMALIPVFFLGSLGHTISLNSLTNLDETTQQIGIAMSMNFGASLLAAAVIVIALLVMKREARVMTNMLGIGILLSVVAHVPLLVMAPGMTSTGLHQVLGGVAEVFIFGAVLGRVSVGTQRRFAALIVSLWMVVSAGTSWLATFAAEFAPLLILGATMVMCLAIGIAVLALRNTINDKLFPLAAGNMRQAMQAGGFFNAPPAGHIMPSPFVQPIPGPQQNAGNPYQAPSQHAPAAEGLGAVASASEKPTPDTPGPDTPGPDAPNV